MVYYWIKLLGGGHRKYGNFHTFFLNPSLTSIRTLMLQKLFDFLFWLCADWLTTLLTDITTYRAVFARKMPSGKNVTWSWRILLSRLSPPPWFELLDDEENEDEDEEDMSEDVTSSGSWWQVWEGVGSMIQCNEQWVQLCRGFAICMSESVASLSGGPPLSLSE